MEKKDQPYPKETWYIEDDHKAAFLLLEDNLFGVRINWLSMPPVINCKHIKNNVHVEYGCVPLDIDFIYDSFYSRSQYFPNKIRINELMLV